MIHHARRTGWVGVAAALLTVLACTKTTRNVAPLTPEPANNSPAGTLQRMRWAWEHLNPHEFGTVLSADFVRAPGPADSAGSPYREPPFNRGDELVCFENLVEGNSRYGRVAAIQMTFDSALDPQPDLRPGMTYPVHQVIDAPSVSVFVRYITGVIVSRTGGATFYLVRGDSAAIPPYMNLKPDSTQWYIQTLVDGLRGAGGDTTQANSPICW
jgi:hypothetical protein